ncbi:putative UDP-glucuronate:xylan alpha-glucuronosyltransferase 3 [Phtheirospermum japonicum]|uniref:Hexosyltransferase n=1 Tax=Phtheirospermum japonicum TaxID=374723 RepID=A0A830CSD7_9LAMI|nr:putative UDP-glucuronate:xylan alpha-glucuronosyltransferase 3 [Phtheirospermum japonicum]
MRGSSPTSVEPRYRLSLSFNNEEDTSKQRSLRSRVWKYGDRSIYGSSLDRILSCKFSTLKLVMVIIVIGAFFTLLRSPSVHETDHISSSRSRSSLVDRWIRDRFGIDQSYSSYLNINWDDISAAIERLTDRDEYKGIGLLNLNEQEMNEFKQLLPDAEHITLALNYASKNVTWETLYPEWLDEEEEFEVPICPNLPKIHFSGKPRLDLIVVKLPCDKSKNWYRDVARLHLQLEAARLAGTTKGYHPVHVLLITECFPTPNLFTCKDLIVRKGNVWLYKPNLNTFRQKLQLPVGSCELALPLNTKENRYLGNVKREAYATILHSAHIYVCGAIAAAQSIRMAGSTRDLVILVDETITDYHRSGLEAAGWKIHTIQRIRNPKAERDAYNEWNYSKFRLWQLTDYDKIIFIDADLLVLRNIDFLFEMPEISATGNNATLFNSGVMLIEPSNCTFQLLMDHINEIESYNGGDQGYLNEIFTWWHRIPKHMNFLKHFWIGDEEEKKEMKTRLFGADPPVLYVLHYLGLKPWLCFRDYDCNWNVDILQEFASDVAHATWWKVHDAMPENLQKYCLLRSKQKAALEWDRRQAEKGNYSDGHWKIKIEDKRLSTCFEEFCFWESMLWHWGEKNWTDNATVTTTQPPPSTIQTASLSSL